MGQLCSGCGGSTSTSWLHMHPHVNEYYCRKKNMHKYAAKVDWYAMHHRRNTLHIDETEAWQRSCKINCHIQKIVASAHDRLIISHPNSSTELSASNLNGGDEVVVTAHLSKTLNDVNPPLSEESAVWANELRSDLNAVNGGGVALTSRLESYFKVCVFRSFLRKLARSTPWALESSGDRVGWLSPASGASRSRRSRISLVSPWSCCGSCKSYGLRLWMATTSRRSSTTSNVNNAPSPRFWSCKNFAHPPPMLTADTPGITSSSLRIWRGHS